MQSEANAVLEDDGGVCGVRAKNSAGELDIKARLVIGADGRGSTVRNSCGLAVDALGAPMDVLWFSLPTGKEDPDEAMGSFAAGNILIMIRRTTHWQCGLVINKGSRDQLQAAGIDSLRQKIVQLAPFVDDRRDEIRDWDQIKLLTVSVERVRTERKSVV